MRKLKKGDVCMALPDIKERECLTWGLKKGQLVLIEEIMRPTIFNIRCRIKEKPYDILNFSALELYHIGRL